jgi:hypothetical protein
MKDPTIYQMISGILKDNGQIMSAGDLLAIGDVKQKISAMYRTTDPVECARHISNTMGYMWRKGLVDRYRSNRVGERAWYVYAYRKKALEISPPAQLPKIEYKLKDDAGAIVMEIGNLVLTITRK